MPAKDWTEIYKKHKGLWVGLKKDEATVVASGDTVKEVIKNLIKLAIRILFYLKSQPK